MKIIWTLTLLMIPGVLSSISVTGYSGGGVIISCSYDRKHTENAKYFCRGKWSACKDQIRTSTKEKWVDGGNVSLYDDTGAAFFNVSIRDLSEQDSDMYYCGTDINAKFDPHTEVNLNVLTADCCEKSISLSAAAGGSVNISCKYPQSHSADVKFVCRRSGSDLCAEETSVEESRRWSAEGQIQLYDDREQQLLTGTISHVTQQHSAEYWCGVQSDQGHKSFITRVLINITGESPLITSASPVTGSSLIIIVSALLLMIITVILLVIMILWRRRVNFSSNTSHTIPANNDAVSLYNCVYEEIDGDGREDNHRRLPTNPSDSANTVYATPV
ncbi:polymeric immunoglobulin receptor-like isoform X3 [Garra rufa]|uniref:polymeric immunoglobulin receptor-like isoform X3 n=1 Tax=Garra rufa TaxID=137080 RepID=UPI003CCECF76